jgi:hypothetical protein
VYCYPQDNGALSKLVLPQNNIYGAEAGKAFANMLAQNTVLKELDLSNQDYCLPGGALDAAFAKEIAVGISDNRALSILNLAENTLGELVIPEGWTEDYDEDQNEVVYRHTDGREQKDKPGKPEGIIAIANAIPDMGALSKLDIRKNDIPANLMQQTMQQVATLHRAAKHEMEAAVQGVSQEMKKVEHGVHRRTGTADADAVGIQQSRVIV